jgi:AraC family transcriptional regulator
MARLGPAQFLGTSTRDHLADGLVVAARVGTVTAADVHRHDHETAHVVFAPRGYLSSAAGAVAGAPTLVINPPDTRHRDRFDAVPAPFLAITIAPAAWRQLADAGPVVADPSACPRPRALRLAETLLAVAAHGHGALVGELAWHLIGELAPIGPVDPAPIARARELILDDPDRARSIDALAAELGIHPVYLARGFRRAYRTTPSGFGRGLRIAAAARALASGALPGAVAIDHGFADQAHLTRWMRRLLGVTPARIGS